MNVLQVNCTDLDGKNYNGHELQIALNDNGISAWQMVMDKLSNDMNTWPICSTYESAIRLEIKALEKRLGMINMLDPFAEKIIKSNIFKNADIVHYHVIHNHVLSLFDFQKMTKMKPSIWSIHDPWIITGHCAHPLTCAKWKTGCFECPNIGERYFPMDFDKAHDIWNLKKQLYQNMDVDLVVSSDWMMNFIQESPLTQCFKHIHKIPFGIDIKKYEGYDKNQIKEEYNIPQNNLLIVFRAENFEVKGLKYIIKVLEEMKTEKKITIITIGGALLPKTVKDKYQTIELGWQKESVIIPLLVAADIFLMPSLAESFGLMAIEAMASECAVVVFQDTVLEAVTFAPEGGVAVAYKDVDALRAAVEQLLNNDMERNYRAQKSKELVKEHYSYASYVNSHIELYREIQLRSETKHDIQKIYLKNILEECGEREMQTKINLDLIIKFKKKLQNISLNKAEKICIFGAGAYGKELYRELAERSVLVDYIVDNDKTKWGFLYIKQNWIYPYNNVQCVGMNTLLNDRNKVLVIVANKIPDTIIDELKQKRFEWVITKQEVDSLLENIPKLSDLDSLGKITDLDYSSEGVQELIMLFNQTLANICNYYEKR